MTSSISTSVYAVLAAAYDDLGAYKRSNSIVKKIVFLIVSLGLLMNLAACSPYVEWKEDVKLNDGRVIVVEQKKGTEGNIARESWLTINLPEISSKPIVWHENLSPLVLNVSDGTLYIVGNPPTHREMRQYGIPNPFYVCFQWKDGAFERIPFEKNP